MTENTKNCVFCGMEFEVSHPTRKYCDFHRYGDNKDIKDRAKIIEILKRKKEEDRLEELKEEEEKGLAMVRYHNRKAYNISQALKKGNLTMDGFSKDTDLEKTKKQFYKICLKIAKEDDIHYNMVMLREQKENMFLEWTEGADNVVGGINLTKLYNKFKLNYEYLI